MAASVLRVVRNLALTALVISLVLHAIGWAASGLIRVGGGVPGQGSTAGVEGAVEVSVMTPTELAALMPDEAQTPAITTEPDPTILPSVALDAPATGGASGGDIAIEPSSGALTGAGDVSGEGEGLGGSISGGGATFFGVEARGSRFAYIVDTSGSMDGPRLERLQRELVRSMEALLETSEFIILRFSDDASFVGERRSWTNVSTAARRSFRPHVDALVASGGTNPLPAFELLAEIRPRPDAIYFMTDGEFDADALLSRLDAMGRAGSIPVHAICFGSNAGEAGMRRIARQTNGTYTFVAGP